jgi:hypothetical protein
MPAMQYSRDVWVQQLSEVLEALVHRNVVRHQATPVAHVAHIIWQQQQQLLSAEWSAAEPVGQDKAVCSKAASGQCQSTTQSPTMQKHLIHIPACHRVMRHTPA